MGIFFLNCPGGPVVLRENGGLRQGEVDQVSEAIEAELDRCRAEWRRIHGRF
jgi:hypothetical protein